MKDTTVRIVMAFGPVGTFFIILALGYAGSSIISSCGEAICAAIHGDGARCEIESAVMIDLDGSDDDDLEDDELEDGGGGLMKATVGRAELSRVLELHDKHLRLADENRDRYYLPLSVHDGKLSILTVTTGSRCLCLETETSVSDCADGFVSITPWKLLKVIRALKGREFVELEHDGGAILTVRSSGSVWRLSSTMDRSGRAFATEHEIPEGSIEGPELKRLLAGAVQGLPKDENEGRYGIDIVEIELYHEEGEPPWVQMVATNGSWLRLESTAEPRFYRKQQGHPFRQRPLCMRGAKLMLAALHGFRGEWEMARWKGTGKPKVGWRFHTDGVNLISYHPDDPVFPTWRQVVKDYSGVRHTFELERTKLTAVMKRALALHDGRNDNTKTLVLQSEHMLSDGRPDVMRVSTGVTSGDGSDSFVENIPLGYGEHVSEIDPSFGPAGYDMRYMVKAMAAMKGTDMAKTVRIHTIKPLGPLVLLTDRNMTVVMPVRLD